MKVAAGLLEQRVWGVVGWKGWGVRRRTRKREADG